MTTRHTHLKLVAIACAGLALLPVTAFAADKDPPPQVSQDGLQLVKQTKSQLVYVKPGASLAPYDKFAILDCYVEFAKNWQRDYNNDQLGLSNRVNDDDIKRMKDGLAAEFKKVFTKELQAKGGYQVVTTAGPDVLVLRPALINVQVTAPDIMSADIRRTIVQSAGSMTLYLELWDSTTNQILARVMDAQADDRGIATYANRVTNVQAADTILEEWADKLVERVDLARGKTDK